MPLREVIMCGIPYCVYQCHHTLANIPLPTHPCHHSIVNLILSPDPCHHINVNIALSSGPCQPTRCGLCHIQLFVCITYPGLRAASGPVSILRARKGFQLRRRGAVFHTDRRTLRIAPPAMSAAVHTPGGWTWFAQAHVTILIDWRWRGPSTAEHGAHDRL